MKIKTLDQRGIAHLMLILVVLITGIVGFTSYRIMSSKNGNNKAVANLTDGTSKQGQSDKINNGVGELSSITNDNSNKSDDTAEKDIAKPSNITKKSSPSDTSSNLLPEDKPKSSKFEAAYFYKKVQKGMSYKQVREIAGKNPEGNCPPDKDCLWSGNCMDTHNFPEGYMTCYWSDDSQTVTVEFDAGEVTGKSINKKST